MERREACLAPVHTGCLPKAGGCSQVAVAKDELTHLTPLLSSASEDVLKSTLQSLVPISLNVVNQRVLVQSGGVRPLIHLLSHPNLRIREQACQILANLAIDTISENAIKLSQQGAIQEFARSVAVDDQELKVAALLGLSRLVSIPGNALLVIYEDLRPVFKMASAVLPEVRRCVVEISHFLANEPNLLEKNKLQIDGDGVAHLAKCMTLMTEDSEKDILFKFIQRVAITQAEDCAHWIGSHKTFINQLLTNVTSHKSEVQDVALQSLSKLVVSVDTALSLVKMGAANTFISLLSSVPKERRRITANMLERIIRSGYGHATIRTSEVTMLVGYTQASDDPRVRADLLHTLYHLCGSAEVRQCLRQVGASTAVKFVSHEVTSDQALLLLHRLVDDENLGIKSDGTIDLQPLVDLVSRDGSVNHIAGAVLAKLMLKLSSAENFIKRFGYDVLVKLMKFEDYSGETQREAAAFVLRHLAMNATHLEDIAEKVGVKQLMLLLSSLKATQTVRHALEIFLAICTINRARDQMVKEGLIKTLATLAESPDSETELASTAILQKLSQVEQYRAMIAKEQGIKPLSKLASNATPPEVTAIIQALNFTDTHALADDNNLNDLMVLLHATDSSVQTGACWFVASISSNHANHSLLIDSGAIEALLVVLQKGLTDEAKAQAAWGLRNFSENVSVALSQLSSEAVVGALTDALRSPAVELNRHAAWALKFLANVSADNRDMITEAKAFPLLEKLQLSPTFALEQASSAAIAALTPADHDLSLLQAISSGLVPPRKLQRCTRDQIARFMLVVWNGVVRHKLGELSTILSGKIKLHRRLRLTTTSLRRSRISNIETDLGLDDAEQTVSETFGFFEDLAKRELKKGDVIPAPNISDLVFGEVVPISELTVKNIFQSKTKPALISWKYAHGLDPRSIVFKTGDDVRKDMLVMNLFDLFNTLWKCSYLTPVPFVYRYEVVPLSDNGGILEFISNSATVAKFDWGLIEALPDEQLQIFLSSVVGALCAGWVLGIRDRHDDNMLIKDQHIFCHIDFGWIFNSGPTFDAPRLAVPEGLKRILEVKNLWSTVKDRFVEAFIILRRNSGLIGHITTLLFASIVGEDRVTESLSEAWLPNKTEAQAKAELQSRFDAWLTNFQKRFKDFTHGLRQAT